MIFQGLIDSVIDDKTVKEISFYFVDTDHQDMSSAALFGRRALARMMDTLSTLLVLFMGGYGGALVAHFLVFPKKQSLTPAFQNDAIISGIFLGFCFWGILFWLVNEVLIQGVTGKTLGKKIFGLRTVQTEGEPLGVTLALLRGFLLVFSALPLFAGFWMAFWTKQARAWHDFVCSSRVIPEANGSSVKFLADHRSNQEKKNEEGELEQVA